MRSHLYAKLVVSYLLAGVLGFGFVALVSSESVYRYLVHREATSLYSEANQIASDCSRQYSGSMVSLESLGPQLKTLSICLNGDIWLMDKNGKVILDTNEVDSHEGQIIADFNPTSTITLENYGFSDFHGCFSQPVMTAAAPITVKFKTNGYVLLHQPKSVVLDERYEILNFAYIAYMVTFMLSLLVLLAFHLFVYRPLWKIIVAAKEYATGNLKYQIHSNASDELGYLANMLDYMSTELSNSEEYQKKFIANVSHDFRSPLTSIRGYIVAMLDGTIPPEHQEKYLNIVITETERLNKLTESMLTLNSLEQTGSRLTLADFDINTVIKNTCATFEGSCQKKGITFDLTFSGKPQMVRADLGKIQQVLYNLIDNAMKFSKDNSVIWIEAYDMHDKIFVSVKDSGIGIPKDCTNKIWERFYKTDLSRGKDKRGTGLGLSITKEIIQAHGENIDVISTEGVGTEFIFTLKRASAS